MRRILMKPRARLVSYLLALLLIAVESGALAHELNHQLHKPDTPCAQCLFANHLGKTPIAVAFVFSACAPQAHALPVSLSAPRRQEFHAYAVRAPPLRSKIPL